MNEWIIRNRLLKELGFIDYGEYLKSDVWSRIRRKVFVRKGTICVICPNKAYCIHHRDYNRGTLLGTTITKLEPICYDCHQKLEFDDNGNKMYPSEVDEKFVRLLGDKPAEKVKKSNKKIRQSKRKQVVHIPNPSLCIVCGQGAKRGTNYCRMHNPLIPEAVRERRKRKCKCGNRKASGTEMCRGCRKRKCLPRTSGEAL